MKPSVTIDERGIILHLTDTQGRGVAVPLSIETLLELQRQLELVRARFQGPELGSTLLRIGRAVVDVITKDKNAPPEPDDQRKRHR